MHTGKKVLFGISIVAFVFSVIWWSGGQSDFDEISFAEEQLGIDLESQFIDVGEVNLHVVFAGPSDGEPVILIHGFPQFWFMWRHHMAALAEAGYRVAAVDMRGYNRSGKPKGAAAYSYENYALDITGLMDDQGWQQANLVSHDIGAVVSWQLVFKHATRVSRAIIFSGAHPLAYAKSSEQSDVSWYRTFFRMPIIPELVSRIGGMSLTAKTMIETSRPGTYTDAKLEIYKAAWDRDHAYDSMLGAYRNSGLDISSLEPHGQPDMPVLFINGTEDKFVPTSVAEATRDYLGDANVKLYAGLSHWLLEEEPDMTATQIIDFLEQSID